MNFCTRTGILALALVLALAIPALAAGEGKITITNAVPGETYTIYRVFDLESFSTASGAYAYKTNETWSAFANQAAIKGVYVNVDDQGYVTWVDGADAAKFAKLAKAYAKDNNITPIASKDAPAAATGATTSTVAFEGLDLGYYLVDTSMGTLCSLNTTDPNATIQEKNVEPGIEKEVKEGANWGDSNDAGIGDVVEFRAIITAQAGAEGYVMHDTMSAGLSFNSVTGVTLNGNAVAASNYTVTSTGLGDGCTFEVAFTQAFCDTLKENDKIVVFYNAVVNENAVISGNGNPNEVELEYGEGNHTVPDTTTTYVWEFNVFKYTAGTDDAQIPLSGVTFKLTTDAAGNDVINFVAAGNNVYKACFKTGCTHTHVTTFTTDDTGKFNLEGLDAGTYYLHETDTQPGYSKLAGPVTVIIDHAGNVKDKADGAALEDKEVDILNQSGSKLPETGGMGTTIFYIVGGLLMVGAIVLLVTKKKMSADKD